MISVTVTPLNTCWEGNRCLQWGDKPFNGAIIVVMTSRNNWPNGTGVFSEEINLWVWEEIVMFKSYNTWHGSLKWLSANKNPHLLTRIKEAIVFSIFNITRNFLIHSCVFIQNSHFTTTQYIHTAEVWREFASEGLQMNGTVRSADNSKTQPNV